MRRIRITAMALFAAFIAIVLTGCGGSTQSPVTVTEAPSATQAPVTVTPTAKAPATVTAKAKEPATVTVKPPVTVTEQAPVTVVQQSPVVITAQPPSNYSCTPDDGTCLPVTSLPSGLYCRDLKAYGYNWSEAITYWNYWGKPSNMDIDLNGIPCETVY